jgi:hypothetical protein
LCASGLAEEAVVSFGKRRLPAVVLALGGAIVVTSIVVRVVSFTPPGPGPDNTAPPAARKTALPGTNWIKGSLRQFRIRVAKIDADTFNPADLMPPGALFYLEMNRLDQTLRKVVASKWWRSIKAQLKHQSSFQAKIKVLGEYVHELTGLDWPGFLKMVGGRFSVAIYSVSGSPDDDRILIGMICGDGSNLYDVVESLMGMFWKSNDGGPRRPMFRRGKVCGLTYLRLLSEETQLRPLHILVINSRMFYLSTHPKLIRAVVKRLDQKDRPTLSRTETFRLMSQNKIEDARLRMFIRLSPRLKKISGENDPVVRFGKAVVLVSDLSNWFLRLELDPKHNVYWKLFGRLGRPTNSAVVKLLPGRPLAYYGLLGLTLTPDLASRLALMWISLGKPSLLKDPKKGLVYCRDLLTRAVRAAGFNDLAQVTSRLGGEIGLAVFSIFQKGLPVPKALLYLKVPDSAAGQFLVKKIINRLVSLKLIEPEAVMAKKTPRGEITYIVTPMGYFGAVRVGPFLVLGSDLTLLKAVLTGRFWRPQGWFWTELAHKPRWGEVYQIDLGRLTDEFKMGWALFGAAAPSNDQKFMSEQFLPFIDLCSFLGQFGTLESRLRPGFLYGYFRLTFRDRPVTAKLPLLAWWSSLEKAIDEPE